MIQRIQSVCLSAVCIGMIAFLKLPVWEKVYLGSVCTIKPYALIAFRDRFIIFPYGFPALLTCSLALTAAYAIMRHDNRKLQLRLTSWMSLTLVLLVISTLLLVHKANSTYLLDGSSSYKIGMAIPFVSLIANLLARYHIKKDEELVNDNALR